MDDSTRGGEPESNRGTQVFAFRRVVGSPLGPREAFIAAHDRLTTLAGIAPQGALVIAAVDPSARVLEALLLPDRSALVIGRHSQCGLRLPRDPVSLRHLAVLARGEEGRSVAHLWDLNTQRPFLTEDGQQSSAVIADGPVYAAIGEYALWIVPAGLAVDFPPVAADAWAALPERRFVDRRAPPAGGEAGHPRPAPRPQARLEHTNVTSIGAPLLLGDGDEPEIGWGTLRFDLAGHKQKRRISAERLAQGILVGRYERCGMSLGQGTKMSRVHLLLVRIGGELWAIDTASTNGVRRRGEPLSAAVLDDKDELTLAGALTIDWQREKHAEA